MLVSHPPRLLPSTANVSDGDAKNWLAGPRGYPDLWPHAARLFPHALSDGVSYEKIEDTFQRICDAIVNQGASLTRAAHSQGLNPATVFRGLVQVLKNRKSWLHTWGDFDIAPFHVHVKNAQPDLRRVAAR